MRSTASCTCRAYAWPPARHNRDFRLAKEDVCGEVHLLVRIAGLRAGPGFLRVRGRNSVVKMRRRAPGMASTLGRMLSPRVSSGRASRGVTQFRPQWRLTGDMPAIGADGGTVLAISNLDLHRPVVTAPGQTSGLRQSRTGVSARYRRASRGTECDLTARVRSSFTIGG